MQFESKNGVIESSLLIVYGEGRNSLSFLGRGVG